LVQHLLAVIGGSHVLWQAATADRGRNKTNTGPPTVQVTSPIGSAHATLNIFFSGLSPGGIICECDKIISRLSGHKSSISCEAQQQETPNNSAIAPPLRHTCSPAVTLSSPFAGHSFLFLYHVLRHADLNCTDRTNSL
jgi:hypothetical protein